MKIIHFINSLKNLRVKTVEAAVAVFFFFHFHFCFKIIKYYVIFYLDVCVLLTVSMGNIQSVYWEVREGMWPPENSAMVSTGLRRGAPWGKHRTHEKKKTASEHEER